MSLRTKVLSTVGAGTPPLADRSTGLSQRWLPLAGQVLPAAWATECEATKLTRISGAQAAPGHAVWALWQPGGAYSTGPLTAAPGGLMPPKPAPVSGL